MVNVGQPSYLAISANVLMLALSGIVIGALFDDKPYTIKLEPFRLCTISLFLTATLQQATA